MEESTVMMIALGVLCIIGVVGVWNNSIGHNVYLPYSSRAPFLKFYGYPIWNIIVFLSFGLFPTNTPWRKPGDEGSSCVEFTVSVIPYTA